MKKKIVIVLCFLLGLTIFLFPIITNYLNSIVHYQVIGDYQDHLKEIDEKEIEKKRLEADEHNKMLVEQVKKIDDPFSEDGGNKRKISEYESIINIGQAMGYISIPNLDIELPIYNGVSDTVLSKGVGHLPRTSLPVGGNGTHASLTGHRGLPTSKLFRHLDEIELGDTFFIHVLNDTLAYQVDQIKVVLPNEMDDLAIVPDEDYVTLITCEPYMINSHRLLVRGTRIPFIPGVETSDQSENNPPLTNEARNVTLYILIIASVIVVVAIWITRIVIKKRKEKSDEI